MDDNSPPPPLLSAAPVEGPPPGAAGLIPVREARALDPQPTWNRHTPESWAMIGREFLAGATAKQLAVKWNVSPTSIYRHGALEGWSKKGQAALVERQARMRAAAGAQAAPHQEAPGPEDEPPLELESANTSEAAVRLALAAVSRCLKAGRYAEAERLGKLAETLSRMQPALPPFSHFLEQARQGAAGGPSALGSGA